MDSYSGSIISFDLFLNPLLIIPSFLIASFAALQHGLIMNRNIFDMGCKLGMIKYSHFIHHVTTSKDFVSFEA